MREKKEVDEMVNVWNSLCSVEDPTQGLTNRTQWISQIHESIIALYYSLGQGITLPR